MSCAVFRLRPIGVRVCRVRGALAIAAEFPDVMTLKVLEKAECEKLGMGSFLGVAEVSEGAAQLLTHSFIITTHTSAV
jgi:leucyl aminopeptidase